MVAQNEKNKKKWGQILKLESPKPGSSRELFLPENGFKTCYTVYFSKKHPDLGGLEINGRHEIQT